MPSIRNIAKQAGVSIATVSRALNNDPGISEQTRANVLAIANSRGYRGSVGRRVTTNLAFAYSGEQKLSHPFESAVLEGMAQGLEETDLNIVLLNLKRERRPNESFTQTFLRNGVRGALLRVVSDSRGICEEIADEGFPHVVISERFDSGKVNCIDCDSKQDSIKAVEYLIALGHRRIGFATHNIPDRDHVDRREGYEQALAARGIPFRPEFVFSYPSSLSGGATIVKMAVSMKERPTAIYFADWMLAAGGLKAAHELGVQVPGELSVIGFDDANMRHAIHPTMTAVCQNAVRLGAEAAKSLVTLVNGKQSEPRQITIPSFFEINESTAPPADAPLGSASADQRVVGGSVNIGSLEEQTPGSVKSKAG